MKIVKEHIISLFVDKMWKNVAILFDCFGIAYIPQELLSKIRDKSISHIIFRNKSNTHNRFRIQDNESIMRGLYCITFIEYMLAGKTLLDYTNLFSPN